MMDDEGASNRAFLNAEELGADKALLQAAFRGDVAEAAALLDDHDANIAAKGLPGTSCAGCASIGGHVELLRFLQQRGAHLDTPDYGGATPLMEACRHGHVALAQYLRDQGAGMVVVDAQGWTLAHVAAARQQTDIVRMLVRWGATLDACDSDGKRPCDWTDNAEILQLLEEGVEERGEGVSSRTSDSGHKSTIKAKSLAPVVADGTGSGGGGGVIASVQWKVEILDDESGIWHDGIISRYTERSNMAVISVPGAGLEGEVPLDLDFINLVDCADGASRPLFDLVQHRYSVGSRETRKHDDDDD